MKTLDCNTFKYQSIKSNVQVKYIVTAMSPTGCRERLSLYLGSQPPNLNFSYLLHLLYIVISSFVLVLLLGIGLFSHLHPNQISTPIHLSTSLSSFIYLVLTLLQSFNIFHSISHLLLQPHYNPSSTTNSLCWVTLEAVEKCMWNQEVLTTTNFYQYSRNMAEAHSQQAPWDERLRILRQKSDVFGQPPLKSKLPWGRPQHWRYCQTATGKIPTDHQDPY